MHLKRKFRAGEEEERRREGGESRRREDEERRREGGEGGDGGRRREGGEGGDGRRREVDQGRSRPGHDDSRFLFASNNFQCCLNSPKQFDHCN